MTLKDFFDALAEHPAWLLAYFLLIPAAALVAWIMGRGEGHLSPWKYLYTLLVYLSCFPGILSVGLNIYFFLFERGSIMNTDLYTQVLPVLSMIATLTLIRRNVSLDDVPGFEKVSGLMLVIGATLVFMWLIDRTHIIIFSYLRIEIALLIFAGLFLLLRFGMKRIFGSRKTA